RVTENVSVAEWGATDATQIRASEGNRTSVLKALKDISNTTNTVEGETYTVSFYIKNLRDRAMSVNVNGLTPRPTVDIKANEAKRVVVTGERSTANLQLQFRSYGVGYYTEFAVWRAQVEKGNKATDWSPAPEDMATQLQVSSISQELDNIQLSVTDINNDLSDAVGNISLIDQKANNISLSVNKIEGNLTEYGVGNRNLFVMSALEDYGFFWSTNDSLLREIDEEGFFLTCKIHGKVHNRIESIGIGVVDSNGNSGDSITLSNTKRSDVLFRSQNYLQVFIITDGGNVTKDMIRDLKLKVEVGEESPYSLAPEDQANVVQS